MFCLHFRIFLFVFLVDYCFFFFYSNLLTLNFLFMWIRLLVENCFFIELGKEGNCGIGNG